MNKKMSYDQDVLWTKGKNDEIYTPKYAVLPLIKYIPENQTVWCPFDTEESNFVIELSKTHNVVYSHIDYGQDFYDYQPSEDWDILISNPPFTKKRQIFERAMSFDKPFALLMTNTWLNDSAPKQLFMEKDLQLLMFDKRVIYIQPEKKEFNKNITFSSSYFCWNFLPKQIIMEELFR